MLSTLACAFATTPSWYLVARHFNGVGWGSQSLSAYVLGTEIAPRKTATAIKTYWAVFSSIGNILVALALRTLLFLPVRSQPPALRSQFLHGRSTPTQPAHTFSQLVHKR